MRYYAFYSENKYYYNIYFIFIFLKAMFISFIMFFLKVKNYVKLDL